MKKILPPLGGLILLLALIVYAFSGSPNTASNSNPSASPAINLHSYDPLTLPGLQTEVSSWHPAHDTLKQRLDLIGLPSLEAEGDLLHTHQHLDIVINGKAANIPSDIGIASDHSFISPIHTHDQTGIIHVESPVKYDFTLGQFFDIWGLRFSDTCLGAYCATTTPAKSLRVYINGQLAQKDYRNIILEAHQQIFISYDLTANIPSPIPSTYNFPSGY